MDHHHHNQGQPHNHHQTPGPCVQQSLVDAQGRLSGCIN